MVPALSPYLTPFKLGHPVIMPSQKSGAYDSIAVDCPFVFRHNDKFYMMHVGYDGIGYQTALACSEHPEGPFQDICTILRRDREGRWDSANAAGIWMLSTQNLFQTRTLKKWQGKYWLYYHSYPGEGYESGAASIGAAWCDREDLTQWHRLEQPILTPPVEPCWEHGGLYKNCVVEHEGKWYLFYNAKNVTEGSWQEQTGICVGEDPIHFTRLPNQPAIKVGAPGSWNSLFSSDPWVVYSEPDHCWVMYYFGFDGQHACEAIAFSDDLLHWEQYPQPILTPGKAGDYDDLHAHKPALLWYDGTLYHYYCCVRADDLFRTITVAASREFVPHP